MKAPAKKVFFYRHKKHSLTLLEIAVAFSLLGVILTTLWGMYHHWLVAYQKNQKEQTEIHKILWVKTKLDTIASYVSAPPKEKDLYPPSLFTPENLIEGFPTVCFRYRHPPDPELSFNGAVDSLLYINPQKALCLATWSLDQKMRIEQLMHPISSFHLSFFDEQTSMWREDWPDSMDHLPLWMKVQIETETTIELFFRTNYSLDPIFYLEKSFYEDSNKEKKQ